MESYNEVSSKWCDSKKWVVVEITPTGGYGELEIKDFNCGSWHCEKCSGFLRWKWSNIIQEGLKHLKTVRFLTLTNFPQDLENARQGYSNTIRDLRQSGYKIEYLSFREVSKSGMRHAHIILSGDYLPQKFVSSRAKANGLGGVVYIEKVNDKGVVKGYVTKYITKEGYAWGSRKFSYSRRFFNGHTTIDIWRLLLKRKFGGSRERIVVLTDWSGGCSIIPERILEKVPTGCRVYQDYAGRYYAQYSNGSEKRL